MRLRSILPSARSLFLVATVGSVMALAQPRAASACSPLQDIPNVSLAPRALLGTGPLSVPKGAGLVFQAQLGTRSEADAKALVSIEVRAGDTVLPGTLESVGHVVGSLAFWRWVPEGDADLPLGSLAIKMTVKGGSSKDDTVTIEDRVVTPVTPTFTVSATRQLVADDSAPKITCRDSTGGGSCNPGPREVSTRALAKADVGVALSANEQDEPYFQATVHIIGRHGGSSDVVEGAVGWGTSFGRFDGQFDEFCAQVTTVSLIDGTETTTDTTCIQNTLDLGPVPASEESAFVKQNLGSCKTADYPAGTSADNPTGREAVTTTGDGEAAATKASEGGCSTGRSAPQSNSLVLAFAAGLGLLASRRSRRAATSR